MIVAVLLVGGLAIRLVGIADPPAGLPARPYTSAVIAHGMYVQHRSDLARDARRIAEETKDRQPLIEPRVIDTLAVVGYRLAGGEHLWIPRLISSLFWLLGGWFLYRTTALLVSSEAGVIALGCYSFLPFGIELSRSFQPDALMVATIMAAVHSVVRFDLKPSYQRLVIAGLLTGVAVYLKPGIAALFVGSAYLALALRRGGLRAVASRSSLLFAALAAAPAAAYLLLSDATTGAAERIQPHLLGTGFFWRGWSTSIASVLGSPGPTIGQVLGAIFAIAALAGLLCLRGRALALALGLLVGYLLIALTLPFWAATHLYYSLPLLPIASFSLGALGAAAMATYRARQPWLSIVSLAALGVTVALLLPSARKYAHVQGGPDLPSRDAPSQVADQYRRIGNLVQHSNRVLMLDRADGLAVQYYGGLTGVNWPNAQIQRTADLRGLGRSRGTPRLLEYAESALGRPAAYFVVTDLRLLGQQPPLARSLRVHGTIVERDANYVVYRLAGRAG